MRSATRHQSTVRRIEPADYKFFTAPRAHQRAAFKLARAAPAYALFMEQGTGKTKVDADASAWALANDLIDAWIIIAPSGVHLNWYRQELPKHLPPELLGHMVCWDSGRARSKSFQKELARLYEANGFPILCMNVEAILTDAGVDALRKLLLSRRCKLTIDESSIIKNHKAQRTKLLIKAGKHAAQRRILNGTPVTNGPLNLYSQCLFLDEEIFGHRSYYTFSHHYAEWTKKRNWAQGRDYEELISYRNMDELVERLKPYSFRVTKAECLDLPPKIYMPPRYFNLEKEQMKLYEGMRDEFVAELSGVRVTAALALTRLLRLQQIACGYLPGEEGQLLALPGENQRLKALLTLIEETEPKKCIIWARFQQDIRLVAESLRERYGKDSVVIYDGTVKKDAREAGKAAFQDPASPVRFFDGNPAAGGRGLDLYQADTVIYYSNSFSLEQRLQSEDRAHRDGLKHAVTYADLVGLGTVDEHIVDCLRNGKDVAEGIVSKLEGWLR